MERALRFGIVGLGRGSSGMIVALARHAGASIAAAADLRPEPRERFTHDFEVPTYAWAEELCASPDVDVVYVATPHQYHAEHVIMAAEAGKHVVVEKPMALTLAECDAMIAATERNRVQLVVGHTAGHNPAVKQMRRIVASGELGRLRLINVGAYTEFLYRARRPEELDTTRGGGIIFNQVPHQVDAVRLVAGGMVRSVRASTGVWDPERPTEGSCAAFLDFADGVVAVLVYSGYDHFMSGDGVWVSEDFGASWKKPAFGRRGPGKCRCVAVDPSDPTTIYAGTEPIDLFVSHDGATSWERLDSVWEVPWVSQVDYPPGRPTTAIEPHVRDIAINPRDPDIVLIGLQVGYILRTTDGGESWDVLNQDLDADVHSIAIDPLEPNRVWIATGGDYARAGLADGRALYRSLDGGASWEPMAMEEFPEHEYSVPIVVNPRDPQVLYSSVASGPPSSWAKNPNGASGPVIRSVDAGTTWQNLTAALPVQTQQLAQAMAVDSRQPSRVYLAFRGGMLCQSDDAGDTWRVLDVEVGNVEDMKAVTA